MIEAIIAVVSTVIGTIVGWVLGNIKFGKLSLSLCNEKAESEYTDPGTVYIPGKKDYELYSVRIKFVIRLYNPSPIIKAIRDCQLAFLDNRKKEITCLSVKDEATRRQCGPGSQWEDIDVVNVAAYESMNVNAILFISDMKTVYSTQEIRFKYKNERFRQRTVKFKDLNLRAIPRFKQGGHSY